MAGTGKLWERIAALPPQKRELFLRQLEEKKRAGDTIPRQSREGHGFPLSLGQERLWFINQMQPDSPVYNLSFAIHLKGMLNVAILKRSLDELVNRHEAFRTSIVTREGRPEQVITPTLSLPLPIIDLQPLSEQEKQAQLAKIVHDEAQRPFDLSQAPLLRASLIHLDAQEAVLLMSAHHIIFDGWSAGILHRDLWTLYDRAVMGKPTDLPELSIQYVDLAVWQREHLKAGALENQLAYWQKQLKDLPFTQVPPDKPRPALHTFAGARQVRTLSPALSKALRELGEREGVTLFVLLLAAFKALLFRYTGQTDIVVGTPIADRNPAQAEELIGFFVNTLVLRTDLAHNPTFRQLLQRVRRVALEAYAHQDLPFARLVELLQPERDTSRSPLFQVMFVLRDDPVKAYTQQQLSITPQEVRSETSQFDLTMDIVAAEQALQVAIDYRTDLYQAGTIERMLGHLETWLNSIVMDPEQCLAELDLLTAEEKRRILVDWNATEQPYPADKCVHQLFEQQVARTPDHIAISLQRDFAEVHAYLQASAFDPSLANTLSGVYTPLSTGELDGDALGRGLASLDHSRLQDTLARCCFKKNPLLFQFPQETGKRSIGLEHLHLLSVPTNTLVAASDSVLQALDYLDGHRTLAAVARMLPEPQRHTMAVVTVDKETDTLKIANETTFVTGCDCESWIPFVKALYTSGLIEWSAYNPRAAAGSAPREGEAPAEPRRQAGKPAPPWEGEAPAEPQRDGKPALLEDGRPASPGDGKPAQREGEAPAEPQQAGKPAPHVLAPVLLVGSTTGSATVGVMYLASFLRRHGIEAYCQLNDIHLEADSLRDHVRWLLAKTHPKLVGVSLKWFPHIARALEICRLVKEYSPDTLIVLGGDTATFFAQDLIKHDTVDYIVLGDGEIPLLRICQRADYIPNCVYKKNGHVITNPITYLHQPETLAQVYLSHLDDIFVSPADLILAPYLFIFTGRGCPMNCHYCGGAREVQARVLQRPKPYCALRGLDEVRNDIIRLKPFTSTFLFDFDLPDYNSFETYKALWAGIDLCSHHGYFYFWALPSPEFIKLVASTFGYVSLNIDANSLSERHRQCLTRQGVVKPQPTDREILAFFAECDKYPNVRTTINLINGLPFFTQEDIPAAESMLDRIIQSYASFEGLGWGRLHAQPGAPITQDYSRFAMQPSAVTYEDYAHYSRLNLQEKQYPNLPSLHYPFIYYQDDGLNSQVTKYYVDTMHKLRDLEKQKRKKKWLFNETLTYRELDQEANQLARYLQKKGVGPERRVGICLERSRELIVAVLAVLKAGGAYVPLDPAYPLERLSFMARDAQVSTLLTTDALAKNLATLDAVTIRVDTDWQQIRQEATEPLAVRVEPDNLAYILYTSGSTGTPKGVMVQHRGIGNLVQAQARAFGVQPSSRVLQFAPFCFDASVSEILVTLLSGATLCLATQDQLLPGPELVNLLQDQAPNILTCPPSVWAALPNVDLPHLKTLVSAGEACTSDLVARWSPGRRFINAYGPTEATVCATLTECSADDTRQPSIGYPIDNTKIYLLDSNLQPVPAGIPGEIYIDGVGLARGYWGRPDLTAERFIPNPFSSQPGARLYATGDLARYLPDGSLDFIGRTDLQVKIRGSRVELGEIEAALAQHPNIRQSVVVAQVAGETRLVAYWVPGQPESAPNTSDLRSFLKAKLPEYMIPYAFSCLEELPLLPNGKIDLKALPQPDTIRPDLEDTFVAPRDPVEELVAAIWTHYLGIEQVGIYDNFFALGGHSLLITQVLSRIAEILQVELAARVFLDSPTVAGVVEALYRHEPAPGQVKAIAQLHKQISEMSADEVEALRQKKQGRG